MIKYPNSYPEIPLRRRNHFIGNAFGSRALSELQYLLQSGFFRSLLTFNIISKFLI